MKKALIILAVLVAAVLFALVGGAFTAAGVATHTGKTLGSARRTQAAADLEALAGCVNRFKQQTGHYPRDEDDFSAALRSQGCKVPPNDPWHHPYGYQFPGQLHPDSFDVISYGADGAVGGEDENADLVNP